MKVSISTIFLILFLKISADAQVKELSPKNYLGIGIGYSFDHIKDNILSPLNQKGNSIFYSIFYERHSKNILKLNVKYSDDILKSGSSNKLKTSYYKANVGITYLKNTSKTSQTTNYYIGGSYAMDLLYMDWNGQDAFSFVTTHGVAISAAVSKQLEPKQYIESTISIPVIQFLSRPPYNGLDEYIIKNQDDPLNIIFHGKLASFKDFKSINWNVNYQYEISSHINCKVDFDFNIQKVEKTPSFTSLSNRVSTSILYKL